MVSQCLVKKMPGLPGFASTLSSLFDSATLLEEKKEKGHNKDWPRNPPHANYWHSGKHKACRPNAYGMLLAGPSDKCGGASSNDHDLAAMVDEFIDNLNYNSCDHHTLHRKKDVANDKIAQLSEGLQVMVSEISPEERDIQGYVIALLLQLVEERGLTRICSGENCDGDCIRQLLVKQLKRAGYNAALCNLKWQSCGRVPGGEYKYMDVNLQASVSVSKSPVIRIIIDTDFRSQFQIARPTAEYQAALKILPAIYIGGPERLMKIVQIMSEAAKYSLENMSMHVPPWRTLEYMKAKWFSPYERLNLQQKSHLGPLPACCSEQLTHLKTSLREETPTATSASNCRSIGTGSDKILIARS